MHCIKRAFDSVMRVLKDVLGDEFPLDGNWLRPGPKPKFTDIDVMALSLAAECLGIDSETLLFVKLASDYQDAFPHMISRRQYNDRRKAISDDLNLIRVKIVEKLNEIVDVFAMDSMPLEICKLSRMYRNKMGKDDEYRQPDKGYCASQDKSFYGYKLHCTTAPNGVINTFEISAASVHDIHYLGNVSSEYRNCIIVGDKGYINKSIKEKLWRENGVDLVVPPRKNQIDQPQMPYVLKKIRKRVETVFSQLCDQFMIQRNYAKTTTGYLTRILGKITGMNILQFINKFIKNRPVGHLKYALR